MRLIDADKMRENLMWCKEQSGGSDTFWDDVMERLDVQPTIDAVVVRHGRWIPHITEDGYKSGYDCSVCGVWLVMPNGLKKYCPNCGAKMDGGEKDD